MPTTLNVAVAKYLRARNPARGTQDEYHTTLRKWKQWGGGVPIVNLGRKEIRKLLESVYERAIEQEGTNPGRTANKGREHLRAVVAWLGNKTSSTHYRDSRSRDRSGTWRADTI